MVEATFPLPLIGSLGQTAVNISDTSLIAAGKDLLCCELTGGAVILDLTSGVYYGLDEVGTYIWGLIQEPKVFGDIRRALLAEYEVEPARCARDLLNLFGEMAAKNLIEVRNETAA